MELTINNLIKLIIGLAVVAAVMVGLYTFFKNKVIELFVDLPVNSSLELFRALLF